MEELVLLTLAFLAGYLVHDLRQSFRSRAKAPTREPIPPGKYVPAKVIGVYGTAHLRDGRSFDTLTPEAITVDCEVVTFYLPIKEAFSGEIISHTLRLGTVVVETPVTPPLRVSRQMKASVVAPVAFNNLESVNPPPERDRL
jgi:hypothetical protein